MIGYDYGIKPNIMVVGDVEYINLINKGVPIAMGYGRLPSYKSLANPLFACLMFENEEKGIECFQRFKNWGKPSGDGDVDGDAVALSFIEHENGGYTVCIYPETDRLLNRCVPKYLQNEISPMFCMPISFPLTTTSTNEYYHHFKNSAAKESFLFAGGAKSKGVLFETIILKKCINFFKENEIPKGALESTFKRDDKDVSGKVNVSKKPFLDSIDDIYNRRLKKLEMYLPISLHKLEYNSEYLKNKDLLISQGFANWQVLQAACNITISTRMCGKKHFEMLDTEKAHQSILEYLSHSYEKPNEKCISKKYNTLNIIKEQIVLDMVELLKHIDKEPENKSSDILLEELKKRGIVK